ncbi:MAG: glycosyltransferase [Nitrospirota bacterium]
MFTVLHTESSTGWGGQENRILRETLGLREKGVRVLIVCQPGSQLEKRAKEHGIDVRTHRINSSLDISAIAFIRRLIKRESVDIVNTHSGKDSWVSSISARLLWKRPAIIRTRHLALPVKNRVTYSLLPDKIVTVSEHVRQYLIKEKGINQEKIIAIHTGVDVKQESRESRLRPEGFGELSRTAQPERVESRKINGIRGELGISKETPLIGTVAILRKKKGHYILIEAARIILKDIPDIIFIFIGDGPQRKNLLRLIDEYGLNNHVRLLGLRNDVHVLLREMDVFVLPSFEEALGTSVLEAMAASIPVVATNVGGIPEAIIDGVTGILVSPGDADALADAIKKLIQDKSMARRMGEEGRQRIEEHFSVEKMVEGMYDLYVSLIRN